jgi:hypothetical protein
MRKRLFHPPMIMPETSHICNKDCRHINKYGNLVTYGLDSEGIFSQKMSMGYRTYFDEEGFIHNDFGPASVCDPDYDTEGYKSWYYHGIFIDCSSQEEFKEKLKSPFLQDYKNWFKS